MIAPSPERRVVPQNLQSHRMRMGSREHMAEFAMKLACLYTHVTHCTCSSLYMQLTAHAAHCTCSPPHISCTEAGCAPDVG
mmetsp:Transcript_22174/g.44623  ORF Transcript_22174/g.44623 Transcript_22174/m.44623 type:complete len:81 (-) Transcript_22174:665-907(-)